MGNVSKITCKEGFKWVKKKKLSEFNKDFIKKKHDEDSNKGYFLEVDIDYPKELFDLQRFTIFA